MVGVLLTEDDGRQLDVDDVCSSQSAVDRPRQS